jgi:phospholipid/cholesterol/gamma-HCH transport system substrate-binding protein
MRRLLFTTGIAAACAAALLGAGASGGDSAGKKLEIELDSAFGIVAGGDLKIGGVVAGKTREFHLSKKEPYRVIVEAEITKPGFDTMKRDAECDVRQQSLIGEYFIDCDVGSRTADPLPDGGRIPVKQTTSTIPPDLINTVMRKPYRERFRLIISELGAGLAGRPEDLNEVIRRAHPALRETSETIAILRRQNRLIRDFIKDADTVSKAVEPVKDQVARWAEESADTATIQASRAEELARYWNRLPTFLEELEPTMAELGRTAERQIPTLRKLGGAAPELEAFLRRAETFARASRGSIDDLGSAASAGRSAIRESRNEIKELRRLAVFAPRLGKPLRQLLQTIDDRRRSTEADPLAAETSPRPPDKTAYKAGQGFTGMEALLNYVYYQTLGINAFDEFGHLLRIVAFAAGPCSSYSANPDKETIDECKSWLGPTQPGVTTPDPTAGGKLAARERAERRKSTKKQRERHRGAGEPEAPPTPGETDKSKPHDLVPKDVQDLLRRLGLPPVPNPGVPKLPQLAGGQARDESQEVLDYLLGP